MLENQEAAMTRRATLLAVLSLCAFAAAGCGAKQTALPHAVYANSVPIYPGAVLEDAMGSTSMGDTPESMSDGMCWFFNVTARADKMVAFYEQKLPNAMRDPEWEEDTVRLVWVPEGAAPGEELAVVIGENKLSIRESVRPGKRPGNPNEWSQGVAGELSGAVGGGSSDDD
jgi:hypothetical protein